MRRVERMELPPGKCAVCRHGQEAVDTYKAFPPASGLLRNGRVYICEPCVTTLARTIDWVSPEKVAELEAQIVELQAKADEAQATADLADAARLLATSLGGRFVEDKPKPAPRKKKPVDPVVED